MWAENLDARSRKRREGEPVSDSLDASENLARMSLLA